MEVPSDNRIRHMPNASTIMRKAHIEGWAFAISDNGQQGPATSEFQFAWLVRQNSFISFDIMKIKLNLSFRNFRFYVSLSLDKYTSIQERLTFVPLTKAIILLQN
jgi:hypothetical protein